MISGAVKIAFIYIGVALLWIILSDLFLQAAGPYFSLSAILFLGSVKGIVFVLTTGLILYKLINAYHGKLLQSERQYRGYFENNPNPMWIYDRISLNFTAVNEAAVSSYGYSREEFKKMTIKDIHPKEDNEQFISVVNDFTSVFESSSVWRHQKKDGRVIQAEIAAHLVMSKGGKNVMVMATDVTEILHARQHLQEVNAELKNVNETLSEQKCLLVEAQRISKLGGWIVYFENGKIIRSDSIYEILDFASEDEIDPLQNFIDHIHPNDLPKYTESYDLLCDHYLPSG